MRIPARIWATVSFAASAALLAGGSVLVAAAAPASADIISSGGVLSLNAAPGILSNDTMAPGQHIYWPISAQLNASTNGELSLKVTSSDTLATDPAGIRLQIASCPVPWVVPVDPTIAPTCNGGAGTVILPDTAFASISPTKKWVLGQMDAVSSMPMIATISLPTVVPATLQGAHASVSFGFTALGDTENASPSDPKDPILASTGADALGPLLLGAGLLLAGATLGRLKVLARRRADAAVPS